MTGRELKAWRKKRQMTQTRLGHILCVTQKAVSSWEKGDRKIPLYVSKLLLYHEITETCKSPI